MNCSKAPEGGGIHGYAVREHVRCVIICEPCMSCLLRLSPAILEGNALLLSVGWAGKTGGLWGREMMIVRIG